MRIQLKRAYEAPAARDGRRILVDRLWPRGVKKETAALHAWLRDLAPSDALRQWFHQRPRRWMLFRKRYLKELTSPAAIAALEDLYAMVRRGRTVTLVYASKDQERNQAVILKELLEGMRKPPSTSGPLRAARQQRMRMSIPR